MIKAVFETKAPESNTDLTFGGGGSRLENNGGSAGGKRSPSPSV